MIMEKPGQPSVAVEKLKKLFSENIEKRVCVVGASCVGKSTLLQHLPEAVDMDDLLFGNKQKEVSPLLTPEEIAYVCGPWTTDVGQFMNRKACELIKIEPGRPVFGTIVFPSDLIIEITVPDDISRERVRKRNSNEDNVFNMKNQIESEVEKSGIERIVTENF